LTPFLALALVQLFAVFRDLALRHRTARWPRMGWGFLLLVLVMVLGVEAAGALFVYAARHEKWHVYTGPEGETVNRLFYYDRAWVAYDAALAWLKGEAQSDAIVTTSAPERVYQQTGLKAVMPPMGMDAMAAQQMLDAVPTRYIIVDEMDFSDIVRRYAVPVLQRYPERWQQIYCVPDSNTRIYQRVEGNVSVPRGVK
jgi:hypothetical protein